MELRERRFVIERVEMTDAAAAKDLHDPFGFGRVMRNGPAIEGWLRSATLVIEHPAEGERANAASGIPKKMAARKYGWKRLRRRELVIGHKQIQSN